MIYGILKIIVDISLKVFFRKIEVHGKDLIPTGVPLIIASNHPSTMMDAIVIGSEFSKKLHYIARGNLFTTTFRRWLFKSLYVIPIYRKDESSDAMERNKNVFRKCFDVLSDNGSILIFPEGVSQIDRRIQKVKTGTARIALGAEEINNFNLGVVIIPVGLNYSEPGEFRSNLFISFAKPIYVSEFLQKDVGSDEASVKALTERIKESLVQHTIDIENEELDKLVSNIETMYKDRLTVEVDLSPEQAGGDFRLTKAIKDSVHYFNRKEPERVKALLQKMEEYLQLLSSLNLKDELFKKDSSKNIISLNSLLIVFYFLLGLPIYIYGFINNYLPYKLPGFIAGRAANSIEYQAPIKLIVGIITFSTFYFAQIWAISSISNEYWALVYGLMLPVSGLFVLSYWNRLKKLRGNLLLISLFYRRRILISRLVQQRSDIVGILEVAKEDYLQQQQESK